MQNTERDITGKYAMLPLFFWMSYASIISYSSFYLLANGFSNTRIGTVVAIAGMIAAVLQPLIAGYADRPDSPSLKTILLMIDGSMLVVVAGLMFSAGVQCTIGTGVLYAGTMILLQIQMPLINAMGAECINQGRKLNYGVSRAMGSVGYAVMAGLLGMITARVGEVAVPVGTALIYAGLILALVAFPFQKSSRSAKVKQEATGSSGDFIRRYRKFKGLLVGCVLIYISHALINNFTLQIVRNIGGGSEEMGFAQALASVLELPTLLCFSLLLKKRKSSFWFCTASVFFFVKTTATLLAPSLPFFYGAQVFQPMGWGLMMASSVYYVNEIMEEQDRIKGQAYMTMTITLGTVLGALLGGTLLDYGSVKVMLTAGSISALVGVILILLCAEKTEV